MIGLLCSLIVDADYIFFSFHEVPQNNIQITRFFCLSALVRLGVTQFAEVTKCQLTQRVAF